MQRLPTLWLQWVRTASVYLLNRDNLGGITQPVASAQLGNSPILQAAVTYRTKQGTYVAFHAEGHNLSAFRITAANPPAIVNAWTMNQNGRGSPFVTSTDGTSNMIVWIVGARCLAAISDCTVLMESLAPLFLPAADRTS